jgi:hypothetical protein
VPTEHKRTIREYLERLCVEAGVAVPQAAAAQLFPIGEGLTVVAQVCGLDEALEQQARVLADALSARR